MSPSDSDGGDSWIKKGEYRKAGAFCNGASKNGFVVNKVGIEDLFQGRAASNRRARHAGDQGNRLAILIYDISAY